MKRDDDDSEFLQDPEVFVRRSPSLTNSGWIAVLAVGVVGCRSTAPADAPAIKIDRAATATNSGPPLAAAPNLSPVTPPRHDEARPTAAPREIELAAYSAAVKQPGAPSPFAAPPVAEALPPGPSQAAAPGPMLRPVHPIDLATALRLADADNTQVNLAREQVLQAYGEERQADYLWLPSLRAAVHWNKHEGPLQESNGNILDVSRGSMYTGFGGQAVGAGSPAIPGLFASFHFADAIFQPLAAQQRSGARRSGAVAARNDVMLQVALAYLELLRAAQDVAIVEDVFEKTRELSQLTDAYARSGQGLQADADRMHVELALRENDIRRSREALVVASARLAQLLRLEPCLRLMPLEPGVTPWCIVTPGCPCTELVAQALSNRPELLQARYLVGEAVQRLRREKYAPLVPSLLLGASYGGFGGGQGDDIHDFNDRFDLDATAFWEIRNLGQGEAAARQTASSRMRQAQVQQMAALDLVAREVTESQAQVEIRGEQIETARAAVQAAIESHEHNFLRIRQGQGLPIEVLQSIQALSQARREYLRTVIDFNGAQYTLRRALGWPAEAASTVVEVR